MTSLAFGTSGLRGLVVDLVGPATRGWTAAFLSHLETGAWEGERTLLVGRDLRSSSPQIAADCLSEGAARGWRIVDCGALPTPALALAAAKRRAAAIMVTGSHIPDDRNGLKFYRPGEITKGDETGIRAAFQALVDAPPAIATHSPEDGAADGLADYLARYDGAFAPDALAGLTIGVYQQSSVARDLLVDVVERFGGTAVPLGRADSFLPVDTEAHRPEDLALLREWAGEGRFAAIVSADGDADRPLVADGSGQVVRGDILGLLSAAYLQCGTIVTPVTSSGAVERCGLAERVVRTRVGSPFVIEAMEREIAGGASCVLGFEANGGVLLGSAIETPFGRIEALPTRDAVLPILCALAGANASGLSVRASADALGAGHALADRLREVPASASAPFLDRLAHDEGFADRLLASCGRVAARDVLDGPRFQLADGSIVHFRASGNAPELRVYVEARDPERARILLETGLAVAAAEAKSG